MSKNKIITFKKPEEFTGDPLTELLRHGARELIVGAVEPELHELLSNYTDLKGQHGHQQVIRKGHLPEREVQTGIGPIIAKVPNIRDKSGQGTKLLEKSCIKDNVDTFTSKTIPKLQLNKTLQCRLDKALAYDYIGICTKLSLTYVP